MDHQIRHLSTYIYEPSALSVALRLKLYPPAFEGQTVEDWQVSVNGEEVPPLVTTGLGDIESLWRISEPTDRIEIVAEGRVVTRDTTGIVRTLPGMAGSGQVPPAIYRRVTPLTRPDKAIRAFAAEIAAGEDETLARLHALMAAIHERIAYRSGTTRPETTAAEALAAGKGVCQDQAHLFIAAARAMGVPARYVTGYLQAAGADREEADEERGQQQTQSRSAQSQSQTSLPAADAPAADASEEAEAKAAAETSPSTAAPDAPQLFETHAWAEAHVEGIGWIGFDPSADVCPTEHYVRLCSGYDAFDAAPIRGNVIGDATESLEVSVAIGHAQQ